MEKNPKIADGAAFISIVQVMVCIGLLIVLLLVKSIGGEALETVQKGYAETFGASDPAIEGVFSEEQIVGAFNMLIEEVKAGLSGFLTPPEPEIVFDSGEDDTLTGSGGPDMGVDTPLNIAVFSPYLTTVPAYVPVTGRITDKFGYRVHPITKKNDLHTGLDIAAALGQDVHAVFFGKVTESGYSDYLGNFVRMRHSGTLETVYSHLSEIVAPVGAYVRPGEVIGRVGSTGMSTGSHLHLDVLIDGYYVNPLSLFEE